jgi:hypothetical protein
MLKNMRYRKEKMLGTEMSKGRLRGRTIGARCPIIASDNLKRSNP